jgi:hypothetical protein
LLRRRQPWGRQCTPVSFGLPSVVLQVRMRDESTDELPGADDGPRLPYEGRLQGRLRRLEVL